MKLDKFYVYYIIIWICIWIPMRYFTPLQFNVRHTYQLPSTACTNTLVSDFNTFEVVRESLMVLYILIPFSVCLMLWTREKIAWRVHLVAVFLALGWAIVMFGYDINDLTFANVPPSHPSFNVKNLARDTRWCLYYGGQLGTSLLCANTGPCGGALSAIDPNSFSANGPFLMRFVFNILIMILLGFDMWTLWEWNKLLKKNNNTPENRQKYSILKSK